MILETALLCLAANIYHEARGEPVMGRHAVAQVTMNRAGRDPANICSVVAKPKQFSWVNKSFGLARFEDGKIVLTSKGAPRDEDAWNAAVKIAVVTLNGRMLDFTKGARFYHAKSVKPIWRHSLEKIASYGNHLFYRYNT